MASYNHNNAIGPIVPSEIPMMPMKTSSKAIDHDPFLVTFNEPFDADNPKDWPSGHKWAITDSLSASGFNRIMVSTIMSASNLRGLW